MKPVVKPKWPVVKPVVKFEPGRRRSFALNTQPRKKIATKSIWAFEFVLLAHGSVAWVLDRGVAYIHARVGS